LIILGQEEDLGKPVRNFFLLIGLLSVVAAAATGCGEKLPESQPSQHSALRAGRATDYASLINHLRAAGLNAEPGAEAEQPFLSVEGKMIKIGDEDVQVFQYSEAAQADAQAALVSPDGGTVGTNKIRWIGSPHFYKKGKLLVLYLGDDARVLKALDAVLGRQFAGK
jgi:hypothetical protein